MPKHAYRRTNTIKFIAGKISGVHTFPKGNNLKENYIAELGFDLVYFETTVKRFNHYAKVIPAVFFNLFLFNTNNH